MRFIRMTNVYRNTMISAVALASVALVGVESLRPHANAALAVVFPPWVDAGAAIDRAAVVGAGAPRPGRYPFVAVVAASSPGIRQRLRRQGALLLLDADRVGGWLGRTEL